jgi:alpha-amylase
MKQFLCLFALLVLTLARADAPSSARPPTTAGSSWYANAAFYQVFVRSFQDSDGDGVGDLKGLTSRLDYFKELGVNALWLNPITPSPSYHGYDVTDYTGINKSYGTLEDFKTLMSEAKKRSIRVIMDFVPNHTSSQHPWFLDAKQGGKKKDWYIWRNNDPGWRAPWGGGRIWHPISSNAYYYGIFWDGMPDLNWRNPEVKQAIFDAAVHWLELGVDGFRVDAVRYLFEGETSVDPDRLESQAWAKEFAGYIKGVNPDAAVVTEAWSDTENVAKYFQNGAGQQMGFNFDLQKAIRDSANGAKPEPVENVLARVAKSYPKSAVDAIFTGNHDIERMRFFNSGRYRSAATLLLTLPGTPFIYYGEEIGMPNGNTGNDEAKRTPMRWDASTNAGFSSAAPWFAFSTTDSSMTVEAQRKAGTLWSLYKNLLRVRQANEALRVGGYVPVPTGNSRVYAFVRYTDKQAVAVVINLDSDPQNAKLNFKDTAFAKARGPLQELTLNKTLAPMLDSSSHAVKLAPYGLLVLTSK